MKARRQEAVGLVLAIGIVASWAALEAYGIFLHPLSPAGWVIAPFLVFALCWLDVGLFIVAHDAMHGSLAPGRPGLNTAVGTLALACYAGFSFRRLKPKHFGHHRHSGTHADPDFHDGRNGAFWRWYFVFIRRYFGLREFAILALLLAGALLVLKAPVVNMLLFWALPAILSSLQLFLFGTWLPHRPGSEPFTDSHRARSNGYGTLVSLLTCFHFGYHHEHHRAPHVPWWRLPAERRRTASTR